MSSKRTHKRRKLNEQAKSSAVLQCHLARLPLEIMAEFLSYTASPRDILSLARCSKYFYATLNNQNASFIWRSARVRCQPSAIPDPLIGLSELNYAALIFDGGKCDVCGKGVNEMKHSFALGVRLCRKSNCLQKWRQRLTSDPPGGISQWLLCAETSVISESTMPTKYWPDPTMKRYYLTKDVEEFKVKWKDNSNAPDATSRDAFLDRMTNILLPRNAAIMTLSVKLAEWKVRYQACLAEVEHENSDVTRRTAARYGCDEYSLCNSPAWALLRRSFNLSLEPITPQAISSVEDLVKRQIQEGLARRQRRISEKERVERQNYMKRHYDWLCKMPNNCPMPNLRTFRSLRSVKLIEQGEMNTKQLETMDLEFRNPKSLTYRLIDVTLKEWRAATRRDLARILGSDLTKHQPSNKPHPVDRINARFCCTKCKTGPAGFSMTFAEVCQHECCSPHQGGKPLRPWSVDLFVADEQAIYVINQALGQLELDQDLEPSVALSMLKKNRFRCETCVDKIVMGFNALIGHSHRHERTSISLLTQEEIERIWFPPISSGLVRHLMTGSDGSRKAQSLRIYGCRHCTYHSIQKGNGRKIREVPQMEGLGEPCDSPQAPAASSPETSNGIAAAQSIDDVLASAMKVAEATKSKDTSTEVARGLATLYTFNGLRSHVKAKHDIIEIRDEDVFCLED